MAYYLLQPDLIFVGRAWNLTYNIYIVTWFTYVTARLVWGQYISIDKRTSLFLKNSTCKVLQDRFFCVPLSTFKIEIFSWVFSIKIWVPSWQSINTSIWNQGILLKGDGSVRLTSLYKLVQISCFSYWKYIFSFPQNNLSWWGGQQYFLMSFTCWNSL